MAALVVGTRQHRMTPDDAAYPRSGRSVQRRARSAASVGLRSRTRGLVLLVDPDAGDHRGPVSSQEQLEVVRRIGLPDARGLQQLILQGLQSLHGLSETHGGNAGFPGVSLVTQRDFDAFVVVTAQKGLESRGRQAVASS